MPVQFTALLLAFIALFSLGLPDGLIGIAWPSMKDDFNQPLAGVGTLILAGTLGAALSGFFSSWAGRVFGIGKLLALSGTLTGIALLIFSTTHSWWVAILCSVAIGISAGATDASVNAHVARHYSDRVMQWLHASYGVGITAGSFIMTWVIVYSNEWNWGYTLQAILQLILAGVFLFSAKQWLAAGTSKAASADTDPAETPQHLEQPSEPTSYDQTLQHASMAESLKDVRIWFSIGLFFFYTALEVSVGLWAFSLLTESRGISTVQAGSWIAVYWAMFTVGRIVFGLVAIRFSHHQTMAVSFALSIIGVCLFLYPSHGSLNLFSLVLIGFAYAPMFPALVSGTKLRVGDKHFSNAMGLQVTAASLGVAILPGLMGIIANLTTLEIIPWLLLSINVLMILIFYSVPRLSHSNLN